METKKHSTKSSDHNNISGNEMYKLLVEHSNSAIFFSKPNGQIIEANAAAEKMFGYTKEELTQIGRQGILDHTDENLHELLAERKRTGSAKGELIGIHKNGTKFPANATSAIFFDSTDEEYSCTIIQDITESRKAEQELLLMLNNTEECFALLDKNLLILNFNKQFKTLYKKYFHLSVEKGLSIFNFILPEKLDEVKKIYESVLKGETIIRQLDVKNEEGNYDFYKINSKFREKPTQSEVQNR